MKFLTNRLLKEGLTLSALLLFPFFANNALADHWVGTWGTAPQLVETNNNPPSPGLKNNSLRQIVQVSIGGETVRLKLTNEFSNATTEIQAVELARATTAGSSYAIDEASTVSVTFGGSTSVSMPAGGTATSDAVAFHMSQRENVAITIHYGSASSTSVSGHPGSRTTSYLKSGNTTDFSGSTKTEHWYSILALEVMAPDESGAVAILGNSITDGRGSTTNQQNRWADVLSRRLLANSATSNVAVLNMGIGGNCVLSGGLGPTAKDRYVRDLLSQEGVKWIVLFEAVNDLGYSQNGVQTANNIIELYKEITRAAHEKGIYVYGATITPFKNSSYYSTNHESGRKALNEWLRTSTMLDGVIDFDEAVRNPQDTEALQQQYLFENDWLHLNASGYEAMGNAIDLSLFSTDKALASDEEQGSETPDGTFSSNLPLFIINTEAAINADNKVKGTMKVIDNGEGNRNYFTDTNFDYDGYIGIKWRGNSSLSFAQKKYTLETWDAEGNDIKASILGLPEETDWVLLAPYNDLSLVRDVFAFDMWNEMGHWGPRTRMCEVFVNGEYMGVYIFCEKIKRDKNRVDISKLKETDTEGRDLTGGYIVRVDAYDDEDATFQSQVPGIQTSSWGWGGGSGTGTVTWTVYYPKKANLQTEQMNYIKNYVNNMEQSFQESNFTDPDDGYAKWIDVPSFVDYFIHTELSLNADGFKRSTYFFKGKDAADGTLTKMQAGPVWDYNLAYGNCNFCNANNVQAWVYNGCETNPTPKFWKRLTEDPNFMAAVKERYAQLRNTIISQQRINDFFDSYAELLDEAKDRHYNKYDDLFTSGDNGGGWWGWGWGGNNSPIAYFAAYFVESYEEEIATVKDWFSQRLAFLDEHWGYEPTSIAKPQGYFNVSVKAADGKIEVNADRDLLQVEVYSIAGNLLEKETSRQGKSQFTINAPSQNKPLLVVCYGADGSYITYKMMQK